MLLLLALAGCDSILGLGETKFVTADAQPQADAPKPTDACATCGTFTSCSALKMMQPAAPSGVYNIETGGTTFAAYCDQTGDGGGWTLALKVDGRLATFNYDALIWQSATLLGASMPGFDHNEAKLQTFNALAFTEIRIALEYPVDSGSIRHLVMPLAANNMSELFAGGVYRATTLGRDTWKGLVGAGASLQPNCNVEGANVYDAQTRVRLGIIGNEQADCLTPDSRIGVGGGSLPVCSGVPDVQTAGNSSCYGGDNGDVELAAFAWVFVR
ncbi:MAG: hypothetical protein M4D80_05460 [Myxococcota bacterium]|nr:hypothetical protein [Myxococcota bacterium]